LLATADASTFCKRVAARIDEEEDRCRFTLSAPTAPKIQAVINESLIKQNVEEVIGMEDNGVKFMLDNDRLDDLRNVYTLVSRVDPKKVALTRALQTRVIELGEKINSAAKEYLQPNKPDLSETVAENGKGKAADEKSPINLQTAAAIKWVDDVLQLKRKFDKVWEDSFCRDQTMQTALTASFGDFININTRSAEYLSLFLDENLKKGVKGKSDDEIDSLLNDGITLLRYIRDKDLFETYYKKHLSRRLLMKRSASMDVERQMIAKMKMEVGNTFTQRLEAMFKDMAVSGDLTVSHQKLVTERGAADPKRIELDMSVLTSTIWPMEIMGGRKEGVPVPNCVFPAEVEKVKRSFEEFYLSKHTGRKLTWQPGMGTADIRATFVRPNGQVQRHELNVSTYAMVILLQFNDLDPGESLSFEDLKANTNIPENDLIRNLQSLAVAPKTRVLKKDPMSKDVKPTDRFYYNSEFQSKFTKLKIGVISAGANKLETKNERSETEKKANDERAGSVEAAVVRVMK
jgi:cullin 3